MPKGGESIISYGILYCFCVNGLFSSKMTCLFEIYMEATPFFSFSFLMTLISLSFLKHKLNFIPKNKNEKEKLLGLSSSPLGSEQVG